MTTCKTCNTPDTPKEQEGPGVLFAIAGNSGIYEKINKTDYRLIIKGAKDTLTWFEDRPGRSSGYLALDNFAKGYDDAFKGDPPNSALLSRVGKVNETDVVTHKNFKYDRKSDKIITFVTLEKPTAADPDSIISGGLNQETKKSALSRLSKGDKLRVKQPTLFMDDLFDAIVSSVGCVAAGAGAVVTAETGIGLIALGGAAATTCTQAGKSWYDFFD